MLYMNYISVNLDKKISVHKDENIEKRPLQDMGLFLHKTLIHFVSKLELHNPFPLPLQQIILTMRISCWAWKLGKKISKFITFLHASHYFAGYPDSITSVHHGYLECTTNPPPTYIFIVISTVSYILIMILQREFVIFSWISRLT